MKSAFSRMNRRDFLQTAAGAAALAVSAPWLAQAEVPQKNYDAFERVPLGKTGLKMSRLCLGTGVKGGNRQSNHTRMGREKFEALIRGSYDLGLNTFDLADLYGTHPYVVPALKGIPREKYVIISKLWFRNGGLPEQDRPDANVVVERFLKEMQTDYIDLFLLHCVTAANWPEELRKQMDLLSGLKEKGLIKALGVSCHSIDALKAAATEPWVQSVHLRINPFGMNMDGPVEQVLPVVKQLKDAGKGLVGMKIVGEGKLREQSEKLDESVHFVLNQGVDILNVGCESVEQVQNFAERIRKVPVKTA